MNQLVMMVVSEKITRLDAEAQFAHLDALERFGAAVAEEEGKTPDELMKDLLDRVSDTATARRRAASACRIGADPLIAPLGGDRPVRWTPSSGGQAARDGLRPDRRAALEAFWHRMQQNAEAVGTGPEDVTTSIRAVRDE